MQSPVAQILRLSPFAYRARSIFSDLCSRMQNFANLALRLQQTIEELYGAADYVSVPVIPELLRAKILVFMELHRKTVQLEILNARITMLRDEERRRIARELHDSVGQVIAALSINNAALVTNADMLPPNMAKCVSKNESLLKEAEKQIRTISYLLHPPLLDEARLSSALRCYVEGFAERSRVNARLDMPECIQRLSPGVELSIFRVVQECLTNTHSS